jgi:CHASE3 domain sensor protein
MAARSMGLRRSTVASVVALALASGAFAVALITAASSQGSGRELAGRLVPAAAAVDDLLIQFANQQVALRDVVTSGHASAAASFDAEGAELHRAWAQINSLVSGDRPMTARLHAMVTAYGTWLARVADPQIADVRRGDVAAARALAADLPLVTPSVLAVRMAGLRLQSEITGEQQAVTNRLNRLYDTHLGALIAMIAVVVAIAVAVIAVVSRGLLRPFRELNKAVAAVFPRWVTAS